MPLILVSFLSGYIVGSFPSAYLLVRWRKGLDLRVEGSGNVGALNSFLVSRSWMIGLVVLLIDMTKGALAVMMSGWFPGASSATQCLAGIGAVAGHMFPVWLRGKGGRGLATAAGVAIVLFPVGVAVWGFSWLGGYVMCREVNVGSAIACVLCLASVLVFSDGALSAAAFQPAIRWHGAALFALLLIRLVPPVRVYFSGHRSA